jgi:multimeric flavodoxin WrbA
MMNNMNVLTIQGSPRKGGNCDILLEAVLRGVKEAGGVPELINLRELTFQGCISCGGCDETGACVLKDDMIPLYDKILAVKRIIIASPIYFYGVTAITKAFIDRAQALWNRKRLLTEKGEWQPDPDRKGMFVSVAATRGARVFEGAILSIKYGLDAMGFSYDRDLLIRGIDKKGEMTKHGDILRQAEEAGRAFLLDSP